MFLNRHYQNAYVTADIDRAVELLRNRHGISEIQRIDVTQKVRTPGGEGEVTMRLAFAWAGSLQYELIQPVAGLVDIYQEAIAPARLLNFHHVAMRADDWADLNSKIEREGGDVVWAGESGPLQFLYVDARDTLGHYLEYVNAPAEFWASHPAAA